MATISNLHKSILEMSDEELLERHREIRQSRRTSKRRSRAPSARKVQILKKVDKMIEQMTPEMRKKLAEVLEGRDETNKEESH